MQSLKRSSQQHNDIFFFISFFFKNFFFTCLPLIWFVRANVMRSLRFQFGICLSSLSCLIRQYPYFFSFVQAVCVCLRNATTLVVRWLFFVSFHLALTPCMTFFGSHRQNEAENMKKISCMQFECIYINKPINWKKFSFLCFSKCLPILTGCFVRVLSHSDLFYMHVRYLKWKFT